jgi:anti-anti-sigma regulatory factor
MEQAAASVVLEGMLTIRTAEDIHTKLIDALARNTAVVIDCSAAESIDLSFIQLLLAARRSAETAGHTFALAAPASGVLAAALTQGGFLPSNDPFWTGGA